MTSKKSLSKKSHGKAQPKKARVSGAGGGAATLESHPRRTLLLILGMHRSGTSAFTNTFALLGAALPRNLLSGRCGNEMGHFESARLLVEHDKMLNEIGSHWYGWNALSEDFFKSALARTFAARFAEIVREEYVDAELIVVKDPRICRFVPIWREVAALLDANIKIVTPFRNPMEVASSLRKRDNLSIQESLLVWTRHVLEAEFWTRDLPRAFIAYEALLGDWRSVVDPCSKEIGLAFPRRSPKAERQVDIYLDRGLRRNIFGDNEFLSHSNIPDWTKDAYVNLKKLQTDSLKQEALQKLDQVRADFDRMSSNLASVFAERDQRLVEATDANAQNAGSMEQLRAANEAQAAEIGEERSRRERAAAALASRDAELSGLNQQAATLDGALRMVREELARYVGANEALAAEIAAERAGRESAEAAAASRAAEISGLNQQAATLDGALRMVREELAHNVAANEALAAEIAAERAGRENAEAAFAFREAEIAVKDQQAATLGGEELRASQTRLWDVEQRLSEALQQRSYLEDELSRAKDNAARLEQEVRLKVDSERQLKCILEQSNAIALTSQEHLAVEQQSSQHIFSAYAATISTIDQLKQEKAALAVEYDARLDGLNYELTNAGQRLEEQISRNLELDGHLTFEKNANGRLLASLAASSSYRDSLQLHKLHLRRSLAASFWRHQSNCAPTAAGMNVQALEAIAESQNRLMSGIIDFCHASYIFSDRSHRDSVAGTQGAYQLSQKWFIPRILPRLERGLLATGKGRQMFAIAMSGLFDTRWYLEQNADVAQSGVSALLHFLLHGGQEGRDPSHLFSSKAYLATYPDVARARANPLVHFLFFGLKEGREVRPPGVPETG
ncbi:MAG: hypothetical protein ACREC0_11815 [Methylocella sp.]